LSFTKMKNASFKLMSKDIGRVIWDMAKSDKTLDGKNLREDFFKKIELDKDLIRESLREKVLDHIKMKIQPFNTYIILNDANMMFGSMPNTKMTYITNDNREMLENDAKTNRYLKKDRGISGDAYFEIVNSETKYLIDNAILPLNLEWSINKGYITVSWSHWLN
jgi:hypothetical protein